MCENISTGLYTSRDLDSATGTFTPRQNKTRSFKSIVMSSFQQTTPECKIESFSTTSRQKKNDCFNFDGFCSHCNAVFEKMRCFYHFCPCQDVRPSLTEKDTQRGSKKREIAEMRRSYLQEKGFTLIEMLECGCLRVH